jgi:thymidylate synthase (FAD)
MTQKEMFNGDETTRIRPPYLASPVYTTEGGVHYFKEPSVALVARPQVDLEAIRPFLESFPEEHGFTDYLSDPDYIPDAEAATKFAGQLCYMSLGPRRTKNANADRYFRNINESGHGSVYEHSNFSFLFWGVSRSLTHELVRHRAGFAFSQVSQRYVSGSLLRFCMRPEFQGDPELEESFFDDIENQYDFYHQTRERWETVLKTRLTPEVQKALGRSGLRKMMNQVARNSLPNCTEAPIYVTMNTRALRHFLNMRGSEFAETEIRALALKVCELVRIHVPNIFQDVSEKKLPDGSFGLNLQFPKV